MSTLFIQLDIVYQQIRTEIVAKEVSKREGENSTSNIFTLSNEETENKQVNRSRYTRELNREDKLLNIKY